MDKVNKEYLSVHLSCTFVPKTIMLITQQLSTQEIHA